MSGFEGVYVQTSNMADYVAVTNLFLGYYTTEGYLLATPLRERLSFDEVCEELWADAADLREQARSLQRIGRFRR